MTWKFLLPKSNRLSASEAASKRRIYIFILCLVISTLFWLFNKLSQQTTASLDKEIRFVSFPEGLVAASQSDSTITYNLTTTGIRLIRAYFFNPPDTLFVQSDALPATQRDGKRLFFVDGNRVHAILNDRLGQWANVENIRPDTVFIELVPAIRRQLPVQLNADIQYEQRFRPYGEIKIQPDSVWITGPESILDTLEYISTAFWSSGRLRQNTQQQVQLLRPLPLKSLQLENEHTVVTVPVEEFTESSIELPINVTRPDDASPIDVRLFPGRVTVSYLVALRDYLSVNEHMFKASVPCPGSAETSDTRLKVQLESHPAFIDILNISPPFIEYIVIE